MVGVWREGFKEPLGVMGNLPCGRLVEIYSKRMKIEQTFKDAKSLLGMEKAMNKKRRRLETPLAMGLIAYALGLMVGERARDEAYRPEGEKGGLRTV